MKTIPNILQLALVCALLLFGALLYRQPAPVEARAPAPADETCSSTRTVQVTGSAVVNVVPDRAMVQLGVQSNGQTPDFVREANARQIHKVIDAVRQLGIDSKDIATDSYIVYPVYSDYNSLVISGYRIDNTVSITLRDVAKAGDVIVAALRVGANEVQDVQFYTSELRKYRDQARAMAMTAAKEKAQALAEAGGAQVGCVLSISENSWYQYFGSYRGGRTAAMWTQNAVQNAAPQSSSASSSGLEDAPVTLGQIAVEAQVSASYSLK
jgi:uncharacterized protein